MHVLNSKIRSHTKVMGWGAEAMLPCGTQASVGGASVFYYQLFLQQLRRQWPMCDG